MIIVQARIILAVLLLFWVTNLSATETPETESNRLFPPTPKALCDVLLGYIGARQLPLSVPNSDLWEKILSFRSHRYQELRGPLNEEPRLTTGFHSIYWTNESARLPTRTGGERVNLEEAPYFFGTRPRSDSQYHTPDDLRPANEMEIKVVERLDGLLQRLPRALNRPYEESGFVWVSLNADETRTFLNDIVRAVDNLPPSDRILLTEPFFLPDRKLIPTERSNANAAMGAAAGVLTAAVGSLATYYFLFDHSSRNPLAVTLSGLVLAGTGIAGYILGEQVGALRGQLLHPRYDLMERLRYYSVPGYVRYIGLPTSERRQMDLFGWADGTMDVLILPSPDQDSSNAGLLPGPNTAIQVLPNPYGIR